MSKSRYPAPRKQRGAMLVLAAMLILFLTSFAVLAFDVGRITLTRGELQNAADAAALAGANCLAPVPASAPAASCGTAPATTGPNWARATARAQDFIDSNSAAGLALQTADVDTGYWNLSTIAPSGSVLSTATTGLGQDDRPSVRVRVRKAPDANGGPLPLLSRLIFGNGNDPTLAAEAVAVISSPSQVPDGALLPLVINQCMFDRFWDSTTNQPRLYTGNPVDPYGLSTVNQPWTLRIGSAYHYGSCNSGQWTSFALNTNANSAIQSLIANGNPTPVEIGDPAWIQPGTRTSDYIALTQRFPTLPVDVAVAVTAGDTLVHTGTAPWQQEIVAFAGFRIQAIRGGGPPGNSFYIQGQFLPGLSIAGSGGLGPFLGAYTPPRLAH